MNIEEVKDLYIDNGFVWTLHLDNFMRMYAGKSFEYLHNGARNMKAWFFDPTDVQTERTWGGYKLIAAHLGDDIAPVGQCAGETMTSTLQRVVI